MLEKITENIGTKYIPMITLGGSISMISTRLINASINGQIPYHTAYGTIGTDYFGILAQIGVSQAANSFSGNEISNIMNEYAYPIGWAVFHTALECASLIGLENMDTRGGFDPLDIVCYWGGALTMSLFAKYLNR